VTSTPVVARINHDHIRAQPWAKWPLRSKKLDVIDAMPSTIVYTAIVGISQKTVRNQWKDKEALRS
jgi:hypothetical protein